MRDNSKNIPSFDSQAAFYNKRTGFSKALCVSIAHAVVAVTKATEAPFVLEVGCGTGQIGSELDGLSNGYLGLDVSRPMLSQFRKNHPDIRGSIKQCDARKTWPYDDNRANIIFSSRALHWLNIDHIVSESYRVTAHDEGYLVVGRVERAKDSWETLLREKLHQLLRYKKLQPLDGETHLIRLTSALSSRGSKVLEPVVVGTWHSQAKLDKVIESWSSKEGLAGTLPSSELKASILKELRRWAIENLGDNVGTQRRYTLYGFKLVH